MNASHKFGIKVCGLNYIFSVQNTCIEPKDENFLLFPCPAPD